MRLPHWREATCRKPNAKPRSGGSSVKVGSCGRCGGGGASDVLAEVEPDRGGGTCPVPGTIPGTRAPFDSGRGGSRFGRAPTAARPGGETPFLVPRRGMVGPGVLFHPTEGRQGAILFRGPSGERNQRMNQDSSPAFAAGSTPGVAARLTGALHTRRAPRRGNAVPGSASRGMVGAGDAHSYPPKGGRAHFSRGPAWLRTIPRR